MSFSSSVVRLAQPNYAAYAASKGAVNAIAPGPTATPLFLDGKDDATIENLARLAPLERLGTPEDIANAVAFLTGPDGRWVNGQVLFANGGIA